MPSSAGGGRPSTGLSKPVPPRAKAGNSIASSAALVVVLSITVFFIAGPVTRIIYRRSRVSAGHSTASTPQKRRQSIVQSIKDRQAIASSSADLHPTPTPPSGTSLGPRQARGGSSGSLGAPGETPSARARSRSNSFAASAKIPQPTVDQQTSSTPAKASSTPVASGSGCSSSEREGPASASTSASTSQRQPPHECQAKPNSASSSAKKSKKGKGKTFTPPSRAGGSSASPAGARSSAAATLSSVVNSRRDWAVETDPPPIIERVHEATQTNFEWVDPPSVQSSARAAPAPPPAQLAHSTGDRPAQREAETQTETLPSGSPPPRQRDKTTTPRGFNAAGPSAFAPIESASATSPPAAPPTKTPAELRPTFDLHAAFQATPPPDLRPIEPSHSPESHTSSAADYNSSPRSATAAFTLMSPTPAPSTSSNRSRNKARKSAAAEKAAAAAASLPERVIPGLPRRDSKVGEENRGRTSLSPLSSSKPALAPLDVPPEKNRRLSTLSSSSVKSNMPSAPSVTATASVEEDFWGPSTLKAWDANSRTAESSSSGLGLAMDATGKPSRVREGSICAWSDTSASLSDAGRNGSGSTRMTSPEASPCAGPRMNGLHSIQHPPPGPSHVAPIWSPQAVYHPQQQFHPMGFPIPDRSHSPPSHGAGPATPNRMVQVHVQQAQMIAAHQHQQQQQIAYAQQQVYVHQQQALIQLHAQHAQVGAQLDREMRAQQEGWHSHPASPAPGGNAFKGLAPPGPGQNPLAFHQPPGPSRQGSTSSSVGGKHRKQHNSPRVHQNGSLYQSHGPSTFASERPAPSGSASDEWRARLRQTEMELDRAGKELEIARWKLAVVEDDRRAEENDHQAALRALAMRAQRAEARLKALEDANSRAIASSASAAGSSSAASASGSGSPIIKPIEGSELGESPPSATRSEYGSSTGPSEVVHPLAWLDLDAVSFPAPMALSPNSKPQRPSLLSSPSQLRHNKSLNRNGRQGKGTNRRWSQGPDGPAGETAPGAEDDEDDNEIEIVLSSSRRKTPARQGSWREDELVSSAGELELSVGGSERWEGESDGLQCDGESSYIGTLPRFIGSSSGSKGSPMLSAEPDEVVDHNQLPAAGALEASGLPSFSLDEPTPSAEDVEGDLTETISPVESDAKSLHSASTISPRPISNGPLAEAERSNVALEQPSPQAPTVAHALLSY